MLDMRRRASDTKCSRTPRPSPRRCRAGRPRRRANNWRSASRSRGSVQDALAIRQRAIVAFQSPVESLSRRAIRLLGQGMISRSLVAELVGRLDHRITIQLGRRGAAPHIDCGAHVPSPGYRLGGLVAGTMPLAISRECEAAHTTPSGSGQFRTIQAASSGGRAPIPVDGAQCCRPCGRRDAPGADCARPPGNRLGDPCQRGRPAHNSRRLLSEEICGGVSSMPIAA
jgi:hypothetical protein